MIFEIRKKMALSSLSPSNMLGELGRLASWLKGDCVAAEEIGGLAVTEKVG